MPQRQSLKPHPCGAGLPHVLSTLSEAEPVAPARKPSSHCTTTSPPLDRASAALCASLRRCYVARTENHTRHARPPSQRLHHPCHFGTAWRPHLPCAHQANATPDLHRVASSPQVLLQPPALPTVRPCHLASTSLKRHPCARASAFHASVAALLHPRHSSHLAPHRQRSGPRQLHQRQACLTSRRHSRLMIGWCPTTHLLLALRHPTNGGLARLRLPGSGTSSLHRSRSRLPSTTEQPHTPPPRHQRHRPRRLRRRCHRLPHPLGALGQTSEARLHDRPSCPPLGSASRASLRSRQQPCAPRCTSRPTPASEKADASTRTASRPPSTMNCGTTRTHTPTRNGATTATSHSAPPPRAVTAPTASPCPCASLLPHTAASGRRRAYPGLRRTSFTGGCRLMPPMGTTFRCPSCSVWSCCRSALWLSQHQLTRAKGRTISDNLRSVAQSRTRCGCHGECTRPSSLERGR